MTNVEDRRAGEEGVALFYALLITLVVSGIIVVVFATAISEQRQAAFELDFEDTVHVAETGAETYLARLALDNSDDSGVDGPEALGQDPAEWAIAVATAETDGVYDFASITTSEGEAVAIRPSGEDAEFVYGVGFTPSRDAYVDGVGSPYVRVVRVQVAFAPATFSGDKALLVGGALELNGNYKIYGSSGAVHTNGKLTISGDAAAAEAEGGTSYSGSCDNGCDKATGPVSPEPISPLSVAEFWGTEEAKEVAAAGDWYDYCAGTWRKRNLGDTAPCQGAVVGIADPNIQPWNGTNYSNPVLPSEAVYYFDGDVDISVKQPTGRLSFFTGGDITLGATPSGSDLPEARYPAVYAIAEGDVFVNGNAAAGDVNGTSQPALVWANGTVNISGTAETNQIAFIGYDGANVGSSYKGGGGGSITYNGGAIVNLPGPKTPIVVQWDEVR